MRFWSNSNAAARWAQYEAALLVLCGALVAWQLFVPPSLGVADNRDYAKLIGQFCLGSPLPEDQRLFQYVTFSYRPGPRDCWNSGLISSAALPLFTAMQVGKLVLPAGQFDLRLLGAVYAVLFLAAFYGLQRLARSLGSPARWLLPAAALVIFSSASYVPLFNSFYSDAAAYVFLLLSIVAVCWTVFSRRVDWWEYLLAVASVILFATAKSQHAPLALLMIPCFWQSFGREVFVGRPLRILAVAAITLAVAAMIVLPPRWYQTVNTYNALFYQCLPRSHDARGDLARLGVNPALVPYIGQHAFMGITPMQNPQMLDEFARAVPLPKMAAYYLSHPRVTLLVFLNAMHEGSLLRVRMKDQKGEYRLGNYAKEAGHPPEAQSSFLDFWSQLKVALFGNRPIAYLAYAIGLLIALWALVLRRPEATRPRLLTVSATLTGMLVLAAVIVMFDGIETGRHLFLFNSLLDVTVCAVIALASR